MKKSALKMFALASMIGGMSGENMLDIPMDSERSSKTILWHKEGFPPMVASQRHPAKALFGCGWRTESQLKKIAQLKEKKRIAA